jgi:hypothetical protein
MPERPFAFAADSLFVQVRKAHREVQTLQHVAGNCSIHGKTCKKSALQSGIRSFLEQILPQKSFCNAT